MSLQQDQQYDLQNSKGRNKIIQGTELFNGILTIKFLSLIGNSGHMKRADV